MHYREAVRAIASARNPLIRRASIDFVSPVFSAVAAAASVNDNLSEAFAYFGEAGNYAITNGLKRILDGDYKPPDGSGGQGNTYSRLTRLSSAAEVESCNSIAAELLYQQLGDYEKTAELVKVIGELHDNVASHADGVGYSSAQVYRRQERKRVEFAIADAGCGMLANVHRIKPAIATDQEAVKWCLKKGNTTAGAIDDWAQKVPDDPFEAPIPGPTYRENAGNHHAGYGLFELRRVLRSLGGKLWIWTGSCQIMVSEGKRIDLSDDHYWDGVAIEFEVPVSDEWQKQRTQSTDGFVDLADLFGI